MSAIRTGGTAVVAGVGAERGLGAELCRSFAAKGYHVLVAGRTPEKIAQVAETICETGGSAESVTADTTREDDVIRLFDRAMSPGDGREAADVVIFNAGNNRRIDFRELSAEQFEQFWRIGCFGGFLVGREAARRLAPLGRGTIIFTGASASLRGKPRLCALRRRESRPAHDRTEHGAGVRTARNSRRACGDRWRDQRRSTAQSGADIEQGTRRGRPARHRGHRRDLLEHPSPAALGMDTRGGSAPVQGNVLRPAGGPLDTRAHAPK